MVKAKRVSAVAVGAGGAASPIAADDAATEVVPGTLVQWRVPCAGCRAQAGGAGSERVAAASGSEGDVAPIRQGVGVVGVERAWRLAMRARPPRAPATPVVVLDVWGDATQARSQARLRALGASDAQARVAIRCVAAGPWRADALLQQAMATLRPALVLIFDAHQLLLSRASAQQVAPTAVALARSTGAVVVGLVCPYHCPSAPGALALATAAVGQRAEPFAHWAQLVTATDEPNCCVEVPPGS